MLFRSRQIRERGQQGDGMALAGLIIGIIGVVGTVIYIIVVVIAAANDPTTSYNY